MNKVIVSVIIPFYNVENYIRECLESVINQTLREIEIICVNDGSKDNSEKIVKEYMEKNENIILITKENGGQSSARNVAIDIAKGEYIYFLDSDDYIIPTTLEDTWKKAEKDQLDIVVFNTESVFESEELRKKYNGFEKSYNRAGDYSLIYSGQKMFAKMRENREFYVPIWLQLFRRSLITENKLTFYEGIIHEDNLFTFQCYMFANRVGYVASKYHRRRIRVESTMTSKKSMKNVEGYIVCYKEVLLFLNDLKLDETVKNQALEFLYNLYRNGRNDYLLLNENEKNIKQLNDDFYLEHFSDAIKKQCSELEKYKKEIEKLKKQVNELKSSYSYRVGKVMMLVPGKLKRLIQRKKRKNVKGVYYYNYPNVGDLLNIYILKELFGLQIRFQSFADADLLCIGSIMDRLVKDSPIGEVERKIQQKVNKDKCIDIWGTGLIRAYEKGNTLIRPCNIYAVRGALTRQNLSELQDVNISCVLADPGLLASLLVEQNEKKYSVGIIPHFSHMDDELFKKMSEHYENSILIDVKEEPLEVLRKISQCEVVLSTSLHGLIISDSYGIPNLWCERNKCIFGGEFKFNDYYSAYGVEVTPYNLDEQPFPELERVKSEYKILREDVKKKQRELVKSFPYHCAPLKKVSLYYRISK